MELLFEKIRGGKKVIEICDHYIMYAQVKIKKRIVGGKTKTFKDSLFLLNFRRNLKRVLKNDTLAVRDLFTKL